MNDLVCFKLNGKFLDQRDYWTTKESLVSSFLHQERGYSSKISFYMQEWGLDQYFVLACDGETEGYQLPTLNLLFRKTSLYISKSDLRKLIERDPETTKRINSMYENYGQIVFLKYDLKLPAIEPIT